MPRKAKKEEQHIDIVEIDYEQEMPEHEPQQSAHETEREANEIREPVKQSSQSVKPSVSAKRLEALAKGREKARLNRLKKKEEEKQQLKEQLKQELMMNQTREARLQEREPSPDRKVKQLRSAGGEQKPPKQELSESENELEQEPVEQKKEKKPQKPQPPQPGKHAVKPQSKAEEQKKVLQKAKKNIPVFKEESKPKREARVRDFFKPKKVIEVSDDESN